MPIDVVIKDGKISIDVTGVDDASCAELTEALQKELGDVEDIEYKPEYFVEIEQIENHVSED